MFTTYQIPRGPRTIPHGVFMYFYNSGNRRQLKVKAVPLQARSGPEDSRKLRFPDFVTMAQDSGRLLALRTDRIYPHKMPLVLISVRGRVDLRAIVRSEGFYFNEKKNPVTPAGFEPAIFRFVAQHLNHCATAVPLTEFLFAGNRCR